MREIGKILIERVVFQMPGDFFPYALAYTIHIEGDFVNDPMDPGGATKYGITIKTLSRWRGYPVSVQDVATLSTEGAAEIYRAWYWTAIGINLVEERPIAMAIFDAGVLFGCSVSVVNTQRTLNDLISPAISIDGHLGPESLSALNAIHPEVFLTHFRDCLLLQIDRIVAARPTSKKFKNGWQNRVNKYPKLSALK